MGLWSYCDRVQNARRVRGDVRSRPRHEDRGGGSQRIRSPEYSGRFTGLLRAWGPVCAHRPGGCFVGPGRGRFAWPVASSLPLNSRFRTGGHRVWAPGDRSISLVGFTRRHPHHRDRRERVLRSVRNRRPTGSLAVEPCWRHPCAGPHRPARGSRLRPRRRRPGCSRGARS